MRFSIDFDTLFGLLQIIFGMVTDVPLPFGYSLKRPPKVIFEYDFPLSSIEVVNALSHNKFPERFLFGVGASPYRTDTKGNIPGNEEFALHHIYKNCTQEMPNENCDFLCDTHEKYVNDVALLKNLEAKMFKISLCWSRILPNGFAGPVNESSIEHYNKVIDEMLHNNITPMIILFHKDIPYSIRQLGGWTNQKIVEWFDVYARIAFAAFGDRVKYWVTVEDAFTLCTLDYGGMLAPSANLSGIADYICGHHVLLAHAKVYNLYRRMFHPIQRGKVGINHRYTWFEPANENSSLDNLAVEMGFLWYNDWLTHPLFGKDGDYPKIMKDRVNFKSRVQEFPNSRLPSFTVDEIEEIRGAADFIGINFFTANRILGRSISFDDDVAFESDADIENLGSYVWLGEGWVKNTPWALGKLLHRLNNDYVLPEIYITGNGYADYGETEDVGRVIYHEEHINEILKAMQRGIDIRGYLSWSLADDFQSARGRPVTFGLFYADVDGAGLTWKPKLSGSILSTIYKTRTVPSVVDVLGTQLVL